MITLDLSPQMEAVLLHQAQHAGLSVEQYVSEKLAQLTQPPARQLGGGEHFLLFMGDDFNAPIDDFGDDV